MNLQAEPTAAGCLHSPRAQLCLTVLSPHLLSKRSATAREPELDIPMESAEDGETHYMVNTIHDQSMKKARGLLLFGEVDFGY